MRHVRQAPVAGVGVYRGHGGVFDDARPGEDLERECRGRGGGGAARDDAVAGINAVVVDAEQHHAVDVALRQRGEDKAVKSVGRCERTRSIRYEWPAQYPRCTEILS